MKYTPIHASVLKLTTSRGQIYCIDEHLKSLCRPLQSEWLEALPIFPIMPYPSRIGRRQEKVTTNHLSEEIN